MTFFFSGFCVMADEGFESFRARCAKGNCYDRGISHSNKTFHYPNVSGSLSLTIFVLRAYPHTWIGMRFLHGFPQKWNVVYLLSAVITTKVYQISPCIFFSSLSCLAYMWRPFEKNFSIFLL